MTEFTCTKCGSEIEDTEPDFPVERTEDGKERIYRTIPSLCRSCRSDRLSRRIDRIREGDK